MTLAVATSTMVTAAVALPLGVTALEARSEVAALSVPIDTSDSRFPAPVGSTADGSPAKQSSSELAAGTTTEPGFAETEQAPSTPEQATQTPGSEGGGEPGDPAVPAGPGEDQTPAELSPAVEPDASATPTATPTPESKPADTARPTTTPIPTPSPTAAPAKDPDPDPTPRVESSATPTESPTKEPRRTPRPEPTPRQTPTAKPTPRVTPTTEPTAPPRPSVTPTTTPTPRPSATPTPKATPTVRITPTPPPTKPAGSTDVYAYIRAENGLRVGDPGHVTVKAVNGGRDRTSDVVMQIDVAGATVQTVVADPRGWSCTGSGSHWECRGPQLPGRSIGRNVVKLVPDGRSVTVSISITHALDDPDPSNNSLTRTFEARAR